MAGQSCDQVLNSVYSSIFGIPLAAVGIGFFLSLILGKIYLDLKSIEKSHYYSMSHIILLPSAAIGLILIGIQFFYVKSFCPVCTLNTIILIAL